MSISQFDYQTFQYINHWAETYPIFNSVMRLLAENAEYLFYIGVIVYWFTKSRTNRQMVVGALLSACAALGGSGIISYFFYRDRPFVNHTVIQLIQHPANASFPSDHATGAFVIATAIWLYRKKDGLLWLLLASFVALSRIWTGVHYPLDVLAGTIIGIICALSIRLWFARSAVALSWLNAGIDIYENIEKKIWTKKHKVGSTRLD